jgi:ribosomal protein L7/L12
MTDFSNMIITTADNGFLVDQAWGTKHVFTSFTEAAKHFGEPIAAPKSIDSYTRYADGLTAYTLREVRRNYNEGQKITAIKLLRDAFEPRLGLREAKELVESLLE